ncbi:MAG: sulfite exporter TauE/SafE family protein [Deltaproteobacteria bacterium]|nr:sulfite exporter TauE/SafE family protein [Deltaproteobacteria bacterium]
MMADHLGVVLLVLGLMAFFAEYVDSSIGMGYGTTLTPALIILGFKPLQIVPTVLLSQMICGFFGALSHHNIGNVDLHYRSKAFRIMLVLASCSLAGTLVAVALAVTLPKFWVTLYIGLMILGIGIYIIVSSILKKEGAFSWFKLLVIGLVAAFNKGISGGGYGPLVTGGQVLSGVSAKNAIGITSLAEGTMCLAGFIAYVVVKGLPPWELVVPLVGGAILSVPIAAKTVSIMPERSFKKWIGIATMYLAALMLYKILA